MNKNTIGFIGGGNMASSLIGGLIAGGWPAEAIHVAEPVADKRQNLAARFRVSITEDNNEAISGADVVVLAVKPAVVSAVAGEIGALVQSQHSLVVSIAAGVREPDICRWLGFDAPVVRAMPNTPALVGTGATGLWANRAVSQDQRDLAESILRAVGVVLWVDDETLMDAVTALSGSGPAYFFLLMELLEEGGLALGLKPETTRMLTLETAFGAAKMALESPDDPAMLRRGVTSPGGTTEKAIQRLEEGGIRELVLAALRTAQARAREIGDDLGHE